MNASYNYLIIRSLNKIKKVAKPLTNRHFDVILKFQILGGTDLMFPASSVRVKLPLT